MGFSVAGLEVGDIVECPDVTQDRYLTALAGLLVITQIYISDQQPYVKVRRIDESYIDESYNVNGIPLNYGGFYPHRFKLIERPGVAAPMDAEEYEEILEGQEIYQKLQGG